MQRRDVHEVGRLPGQSDGVASIGHVLLVALGSMSWDCRESWVVSRSAGRREGVGAGGAGAW